MPDGMPDAGCFVCAAHASIRLDATWWVVECEVCGRYMLRRSDAEDLPGERDFADLRPYLSAAIRQATEEGRIFDFRASDWREEARSHANTPTSRKVHRLLELLAADSDHPGAWVFTDQRKIAPRIDARNDEEVEFLLNVLKDGGYIEPQDTMGPARFLVTFHGWEALEPTSGGGIPGTCFVAMSFDSSLNAAFDKGIRPAVEDDCGFRVVRMDRVPHNDSITDRILAGIRSAHFVVADFTLQRPGVYFEAGFAMGLGRPVIWSCRQDDRDGIHFDTRQYNHIFWTDPADLREKLKDRIRATVALPARMAT